MIRTSAVLALALACLAPSAQALSGEVAEIIGASVIGEPTSKDHAAIVMGRASPDQVKQVAASAQSNPGRRVPVIVDGVLVEMNEAMVRALLKSGIFILVAPGTSTPYEGGIPGYPPIWVNYPQY